MEQLIQNKSNEYSFNCEQKEPGCYTTGDYYLKEQNKLICLNCVVKMNNWNIAHLYNSEKLVKAQDFLTNEENKIKDFFTNKENEIKNNTELINSYFIECEKRNSKKIKQLKNLFEIIRPTSFNHSFTISKFNYLFDQFVNDEKDLLEQFKQNYCLEIGRDLLAELKKGIFKHCYSLIYIIYYFNIYFNR